MRFLLSETCILTKTTRLYYFLSYRRILSQIATRVNYFAPFPSFYTKCNTGIFQPVYSKGLSPGFAMTAYYFLVANGATPRYFHAVKGSGRIIQFLEPFHQYTRYPKGGDLIHEESSSYSSSCVSSHTSSSFYLTTLSYASTMKIKFHSSQVVVQHSSFPKAMKRYTQQAKRYFRRNRHGSNEKSWRPTYYINNDISFQ